MRPDQFQELRADFTFPSSYEFQEHVELPGSGESQISTLYIPPSIDPSRPDGLWVTVRTREGHTWTGVFAYGYSSPPGISRVMSSPDPERLLVISRGAAYLVKADDPSVWEKIPVIPVTAVVANKKNNLVVFGDFNRLFAYGPEGLRWTTPPLCLDDLKIISAEDDVVNVSGYDLGGAPMVVDSIVDLRTGRVSSH